MLFRSNALDSLQAANEQLQQDIEREREQEKQRVDFFTSVSHELKTPIAIIKGQLEGMIYQVGEYKDRDTYLRRCMKTTDVYKRQTQYQTGAQYSILGRRRPVIINSMDGRIIGNIALLTVKWAKKTRWKAVGGK